MATLTVLLAALHSPVLADGPAWIDLIPRSHERDAWQGDNKEWTVAGDAALDPNNPRALVAKPGDGVLISSLSGHIELRNLSSRQAWADLETHAEFLIPKGANAGLKLQGLYEIQIKDTQGKKNPTGDDCGGVYPRAELTPRYHTIDQGISPRTNAALAAGQWQTLDVVFQAPRFDKDGKKTANARFKKVVLNGQVIHEDVELKWPTGHAWRKEKEVASGPLFLQGDHGPVAYRNVRVRPLDSAKP